MKKFGGLGSAQGDIRPLQATGGWLPTSPGDAHLTSRPVQSSPPAEAHFGGGDKA
jgi:hypothetical protein